jgi:hypothetical protein
MTEELSYLISQHEVEICEMKERYEGQLQKYSYKDEDNDEWERVHKVAFEINPIVWFNKGVIRNTHHYLSHFT